MAHASPILMLLVVALARCSLSAAEMETPSVTVRIAGETGGLEIHDKRANVTWGSTTNRFGEVTLLVEGKARRFPLTRPKIETMPQSLSLVFQPLTNSSATLRVRILSQNQTLSLSYSASPEFQIENVRLLGELLHATSSGAGYAIVPVREGLLVPAESGLSFTNRFDTYAYEGCHMAMLGVVQAGAAAMLTWQDPYAAVEVQSVVHGANEQTLSCSIVLRKAANSFNIHFLGRGDYVTVARAYHEIAKERGLLVTWDQKLKENPARAKYLGASNYKLWSTLDRRMSEDSSKEERVRVNWTFDEAAQVAAHLKNDLKLDRVLFSMGGWIHRGYDNQHPDILPTAPESGGDEAFARACKRIRDLGYVLTLHDNYQDMYRDSPSWDERFIQKNANASLVKGGHWAGGFAYITCSKMALELAQRPQNLPAVKKLSNADSYFIDTTYAAGLQECFDPEHPLKRGDDIHWKAALSDYARTIFGSFGSECGREWAIPHADFFEGLTGVSGSYYHNKDLLKNTGGRVIPLFELVYRDCIAAYGKYGYDPFRSTEYVLHHIAIGRPLNYHNVPAHLYWTEANQRKAPIPSSGLDPAQFTRADQGWAEGLHSYDRFVKNTHEVLSPLNEVTARLEMTGHQFLTPDHKVQQSIFGSDFETVVVTVNASDSDHLAHSSLSECVAIPPGGFLVESQVFVAFCATSWKSQKFTTPTLFTLRALDGKSLSDSKKIRVFHAFGDASLPITGRIESIARECILEKL